MERTAPSGRWNSITAALSGICAGAMLFGTAQLVSVFFSVSSSPMVALGSTTIDFTPPWLKDLAISLFGMNDKLVLFICIGVVGAVVSALLGLLARRSYRLSAAAIILLAAVVAVAMISRASTGAGDLVPILLGTACGLAVLKWLTVLASRIPGGIHAPGRAGSSRRDFLLASSVSLAAAVLAAGVAKSLTAARNAAEAARAALGLPEASRKAAPLPAAVQFPMAQMPPFITPNQDFYRIDTALSVPVIDPAQWSLRVHGMVENEFTLSFEQLLAEDLVETYLTLTCVSNPVGGDLVGNAKWLGYPLRKLLERAVPTTGADMVLSTSVDGFSASTPLTVLTDDRMALLAIGMNDEPLPLEHGFPVRMVVPGLYGYVSATKWLVDLEVTRFQDKTAYWTTRGWSAKGPIKMSSRVDTPRPFARLPVGEVVMGGSAWAQTSGISRIEVQVDDGDWQEAELASEASVDTWRQWRFVWPGGQPGTHTVTVRAYDGDGQLQSGQKADPAPDGSSGWHRLQFSVE
ncbi:molybdopterin-dependent oxidoreductase [Glutamicibacter sp. MNS18]|uniref:molybdopterin-dependent oxidoreductase n=1 Tax=Glutamicibacter sp. MNS18 TaxID=2989817 RepID=UPI002235609E|nr:molybdopterin-dependent oxidoreductase [Glutamicibacter sp. MNS18]MCW4465273.1 molybdopterin-dependent oxidoreductase [Glutamicibacter sp. MNS18]